MPAEDPPGLSFSMRATPTSGAFLPLTLDTIRATRVGGDIAELGSLAGRALQAERTASDTWHALLGDCGCVQRSPFPEHLHELSEAAGAYAGGDWWRGTGSTHRARVNRVRAMGRRRARRE